MSTTYAIFLIILEIVSRVLSSSKDTLALVWVWNAIKSKQGSENPYQVIL